MSDSRAPTGRSWLIVVAGLLGATAIALGAFHAHGMDERLATMGLDAESVDYRMELCSTGLKYQLAHAVAILSVALAARIKPGPLWGLTGTAMVVGTLLFSGSLYGIVVTGISKLGAITPLGGLCLIIGWLLVAASGLRR